MNMEKADIKKKIHLALVALIFYIQKGTAFSTSPSALTSCASSTANISVNFSLNTGESIVGRRIWYFSGGKIAESNGTTLTPIPRYSSRLTAYGTSGISLSNSTVADAGTYTYVIILLPNGNQFTATTALSVQVAPLAPPSGCQVSSWNQPGNIPTCAVNTNSGNCGTPSLIASLVNSTNTSSQYICNAGETYQCCAASAALTCYSGSSNEFCKLFTCINATTDVTTNTTNKTKCELELGCGLGLSFGIQCVITGIAIGISMYTSQSKVSDGKRKPEKTDGKRKPEQTDGKRKPEQTDGKRKPEQTEQTDGKRKPEETDAKRKPEQTDGKRKSEETDAKRKPEQTDGKRKPEETYAKRKPEQTDGKRKPKKTGYKHAYFLGLVHGVGISVTFQVGWIIIASLICTGTTSCKLELGLGLGLGSGIPWVITIIIAVIFVLSSDDNPNRVEKGKGMLTGLLSATVIGIIVVYLIYDKLKPEQTGIDADDNPGTPADKNAEVCLELTVTISKTTNSGSSSDVSREQVQVQMENIGVKDDDEERPHKVEQNTISEQTNYRQQPLPPMDTEFENTPYRPLPQPPQNGEIKDRNLRVISATIDDTPGLANETPRNKLPPLTIESKKKRNKRQKKDQMNEETPEKGTTLRVN